MSKVLKIRITKSPSTLKRLRPPNNIHWSIFRTALILKCFAALGGGLTGKITKFEPRKVVSRRIQFSDQLPCLRNSQAESLRGLDSLVILCGQCYASKFIVTVSNFNDKQTTIVVIYGVSGKYNLMIIITKTNVNYS